MEIKIAQFLINCMFYTIFFLLGCLSDTCGKVYGALFIMLCLWVFWIAMLLAKKKKDGQKTTKNN